MKNKQKFFMLVALVLIVSVGSTIAYIVASSNTVKNTFTVGNVAITLDETTGNEYKIIPGTTQEKNPTVTVKANSEPCWLFVKAEKSDGFDNYCSYALQDGWTQLPQDDNVFYIKLSKSSSDQSFKVLKNNSIDIFDTITEEQMALITNNPTIKFTAYAIQSEGIDTAQTAWQLLNN